MTIPQDTRAPHRQQRWIEIENVGPVTIPAFGACEIVGSSRPDQSQYTPLDGRTVIQARLSTRDNPCATIINGPCAIPVYESRRVGTIDDPMLALVASAYYLTNTTVGVKSGSFLLTAGYCGYLILGDYDGGTATMRVKRWEDCGRQDLMVKAYECMYPGDMTKTATIQRWDPTTKCWVDDTSKPQRITICDCNKWVLALPGECFKVERDNTCDSSYGGDACYRPSFPFGLTRRVKITETIPCNRCGKVTILKTGKNAADCQYPTESDCELEVCNTTGRTLGCDSDEYATLHIAPGECGTGTKPTCYGWLVAEPRPNRAKVIIKKKMCGGPAEFDDIYEYLDVCQWTPREPPKMAANPHGLFGCAGDEVELAWNDPKCSWDVVQVKHYAVDPFIQSLGCSADCELSAIALKKPLAIQQCEDCGQVASLPVLQGEWVEIMEDLEVGESYSSGQSVLTGMTANTGTSEADVCEFVFSSANLTTTTITAKKKRVCIFCAGEQPGDNGASFSVMDIGEAGYDARITAEKVTGIVDVNLECDPCPTLQAKFQEYWALCAGTEDEDFTEAGACICIDCEGSSASATPSATPSGA